MEYVDEAFRRCNASIGDNPDSVLRKYEQLNNPPLFRTLRHCRREAETPSYPTRTSDRRATFPDANLGITRTDSPLLPFALRRTKAIVDIGGPNPNTINVKTVIQYKRVEFNYIHEAIHYIYLGSVNDGIYLQQGMTIDLEGRLMLVKGKKKGFIKYGWQAVKGEKKFYGSIINLGKYDDLRFDYLTVNEAGDLIAKINGQQECYKIILYPDAVPKIINLDEVYDDSYAVRIALIKVGFLGSISETSLCTTEGKRVLFTVQDGGLYFYENDTIGPVEEQSFVHQRLQLPLSEQAVVCSAKNVGNLVKLTVRESGEMKIFYLDSRYLDIKGKRVKYLSFKPPQNLYCGIANNRYGCFSSGLPFDEVHSREVELRIVECIANVINNSKMNLIKAKDYYHQGNNYKMSISVGRAFDPGLELFYKLIARKIKSSKRSSAQPKPLTQIDNNLNKINKLINNNEMIKLINNITPYINNIKDIAKSFTAIISLLRKKESISFASLFDASIFFGMALAGIPFSPGFFVGAMAGHHKSYTLKFARNESGTVKISYNKVKNNSILALAGTGQGLEDKFKIISHNSIDYGTLMPLEANIIMVLNLSHEQGFSFDVADDNIEKVLGTIFDPSANDLEIIKFVKNVAKKKSKNIDIKMLLEVKSEIRAQIGAVVDNTYLVAPRTAAGIGGAINIFDINKQTEDEQIFFPGKTIDVRKEVLRQNYINASVYGYQETKIMPIAMTTTSSPNDKLFCFPLPLTEEFKQKLPITRNELARHYRLDGATLKIESKPLFSSTQGDENEANTETNDEQEHFIIKNFEDIISKIIKELPETILDKIENFSQSFKEALKSSYGYQMYKQGEELANFVLSQNDYKQHLKMLSAGLVPQLTITASRGEIPVNLKSTKPLRPWLKNTTLGEFLEKKDKILRAEEKYAPGNTSVYDSLKGLEGLFSRIDKSSLGERSAVMAIGTYKIQENVIQHISTEFLNNVFLISEAIINKLEYAALEDSLAKLCELIDLDKASHNPLFQLDNIQIIQQSTQTVRVGTVPCAILNVSGRKEVVYTVEFGALRMHYQDMAIFPHHVSNSISIMPDVII